MTTEVFGSWVLLEVSHLLVTSIKIKNINFKSNFKTHCVNDTVSPTTNQPATSVRVFKHFGGYRKEVILAKANEAMMGQKAFWYSSKKISVVLVKTEQVVFSRMSLWCCSFPWNDWACEFLPAGESASDGSLWYRGMNNGNTAGLPQHDLYDISWK